MAAAEAAACGGDVVRSGVTVDVGRDGGFAEEASLRQLHYTSYAMSAACPTELSPVANCSLLSNSFEMAYIYMSQNYFDVPEGTGTPVEAVCPIHGKFTGWIPVDLQGHVGRLTRNVVPCPKCGRAARLAEGSFDFSEQVVKELFGVRISRPVRRRFERAVKKAKNPEELAKTVATFEPALVPVVEAASKTPAWKNSLMIAAAIITILAGLPEAIDTADQAVEWVQTQLLEQSSNTPEEANKRNQQQNTQPENDPSVDAPDDSNSSWGDVTET